MRAKRWRMRLPFDPPAPGVLADWLGVVPGHGIAPDAYWQRLRPHLAAFGISRVADITGLDHLGFPVAQAVRPLARSNAVTQGKAATLEGAAIGAVLECLEMAAGENPARLADAGPCDPSLWAPLAGGTDWPAPQTRTVAAWNLCDNGPAAVPVDLVSTDFAQGAKAEAAPVLRHSIGLGAGADPGAAMMHGLMECIEADARIRAFASGRRVRIGLAADDPTYAPILSRLDRAGLRYAVYSLPCRGGLCSVEASVMEPPGASTLPLPASGFAARETLSKAITAALAEAVQARLAVISGAREDITQRFYDHGFTAAELQGAWEDHAPVETSPPDVAPAPVTLRGLARSVGPVFAVPLHWDQSIPLAITRILAPNLIADPLRLEPTT